jgi:hypothetical protein
MRAAAATMLLLLLRDSAQVEAAGTVVLRDPRSMDLANQANVLRAIQEMTPALPSIQGLDFVSGALASTIDGADAVVIPAQENCYMDLTAADQVRERPTHQQPFSRSVDMWPVACGSDGGGPGACRWRWRASWRTAGCW